MPAATDRPSLAVLAILLGIILVFFLPEAGTHLLHRLTQPFTQMIGPWPNHAAGALQARHKPLEG